VQTKANLLNNGTPLPRQTVACEPEVKVLRLHGVNVALDCNTITAFQVDDATAKEIEGGAVNWRGLLGLRLGPAWTVAPNSDRARMLIFAGSHACPLDCSYCFARKYHNDGASLSMDVARKALDRLYKPGDFYSVGFFGGESTMAYDVMIGVAEECILRGQESARIKGMAKTKPLNRDQCYKVHVTTNGVLIDAAVAMGLKRFGFGVLLSLDGPEAVHDTCRKLPDGSGSWKATMAGLANLNAAGIVPMARATMLPNDMRFVERLNFFADLAAKGRITGAAIEPVTLTAETAKELGCSEWQKDWRAQWHAAAEWFVARAKAKKPFWYNFFCKMITRILAGQPSGSECGAGKAYFTVNPAGEIFACHRETFTKIGHVDSGIDETLRQPWTDNTIAAHGDCAKCWARYLCGGGCHQTRIELTGDRHGAIPGPCEQRKACIEESLWILTQLTKTEIDGMLAAGKPKPKPPQQGRACGCAAKRPSQTQRR